MTGAAGVGGRARFHLTTNVALGGWSNALKAHVEYGATGKTAGMGSALLAELALSAGTVDGTYAPLESELVAGSGASTGTSTSFLYCNIGGADAATVNTNGYLLELGAGVVDTADGLFDTIDADDADFNACLKIKIGGVDYFIGLSTTNAFTA